MNRRTRVAERRPRGSARALESDSRRPRCGRPPCCDGAERLFQRRVLPAGLDGTSDIVVTARRVLDVACTKDLITAAAKSASSVGSVSAVNGFGCSGSWAYADVTVGSGDRLVRRRHRAAGPGVELDGGRPRQRLQQPLGPHRHLHPGLHDQLTARDAGQAQLSPSAALRRAGRKSGWAMSTRRCARSRTVRHRSSSATPYSVITTPV